jgi:hypothetical protein
MSLDLIQNAVVRVLTASEEVGSTALVGHPLHEGLMGLYEKSGFIRCPQLSSITLMLSLPNW